MTSPFKTDCTVNIHPHVRKASLSPCLPLLVFLVPISAMASQTASMPVPPPSPWSYNASAAIKESYDNNVYLQSLTDLAEQASLITTLAPSLKGSFHPAPSFGASLTYNPDFAFYHSESSESHVFHRATLKLNSTSFHLTTDFDSSLIWIDGSRIGPTWTGPGGAPATGGAAVRDRRDAAVWRNTLRLRYDIDPFFLRPVTSTYLHDFHTKHLDAPGYQNYVDRSEWTAGFDFGFQPTNAWAVIAGYRYGQQDQAQLLQYPEQYDNHWHRLLAGFEGKPLPWLKLNLTFGPEFRRYGPDLPNTYNDRNRVNLFADASASLYPTPAHVFNLTFKQFEQPGFSGRSAYQDLTADLNWRHRFAHHWTLGAGARAYNTRFLKPAQRNDWLYSCNLLLNRNFTSRLNAELSYAFENGHTRNSNASARNYDRHLIALGFMYLLP